VGLSQDFRHVFVSGVLFIVVPFPLSDPSTTNTMVRLKIRPKRGEFGERVCGVFVSRPEAWEVREVWELLVVGCRSVADGCSFHLDHDN
jgi:hypothetical protein